MEALYDGVPGGVIIADLQQPDIECFFRQAGVAVNDLLQAGAVGAIDIGRDDLVGRGDGQRAVLAVMEAYSQNASSGCELNDQIRNRN